MATNDRKMKEKKKARMVSARKMADTAKSGGSKAYSIPNGVSQFSPKKDTEYEMDIVPFEAGDGNPGADKGFLAAGRTYFTHARIGPNQDSYCCLAGTFNEPCPVCEYRARIVQEKGWDNETAKALRAKTRQLWNVYDHGDKKKGVQVWEISDWLFGKHLFAKMDRKPEYETFASPDDGYTLAVGVTEEKVGKGVCLNCADIQFTKRTEPLDEEILSKAICLDDILVKLSYSKLKAIFEQGLGGSEKEDSDDTDDDDESVSRPTKPTKSKAKAQDDEDDDSDSDDDDPPPAKKGKKPPVDEDEDDSDLEDDEDPDEDEPAPKKKKVVDENDEDEAPPKKPAKKGSDPTASDLGLKKGDVVTHKIFGECDIVKISPDGTSLTLEDEDAEEHRAVAPSDVKKVKTKGSEPEDEEDEDEPAPKKGKKPPVDEDDEDEEPEDDDSDDDDEPAPPKKKAKK